MCSLSFPIWGDMVQNNSWQIKLHCLLFIKDKCLWKSISYSYCDFSFFQVTGGSWGFKSRGGVCGKKKSKVLRYKASHIKLLAFVVFGSWNILGKNIYSMVLLINILDTDKFLD